MTLIRQIPPAAIGATIVVAVFTTADFKGVTRTKSLASDVPIAPAVENVNATPNRFVVVTMFGVAEPVLAAAEYRTISSEVM